MKKLYATIALLTVSLITNAQCMVQVQPSNVLCFGDCNGQATAYANGVSPITYLWSPGGQTTPTITGLCTGTYTVMITDATGCVATATTMITQPPQLQAVITSYQNPSCSNCCDGFAVGSASGGTPVYSYIWNPTSQWGPTGQQLCNGSYTLCVTDVNGCSSCDSVLLSSPNSVAEQADMQRVNIFPNPASNNITFYCKPQSGWSVVNALGETVMIGTAATETVKIDLSGLAAGIYTLKISQNGAISAGQFVKFDE